MKRVTLFTALPPILLGIVLAAFSPPALAVDNLGLFELDGNADADDFPPGPVQGGDDWEDCDGGGCGPSYTRIVDKNGTDNIFTGGGSKTPNDADEWKWKSSPPPPDKNNIVNAFAVNKIHLGKQYVYFGTDLFADNGDAELAFWFNQENISPNGLGLFDGVHQDGDVYVAVKFANGGTVPLIAVYDWYSGCTKADRDVTVVGACAAQNIRVVIPEGPAACNGSGNNACAITNTSPENAHWPYTPKSGSPGVYPITTFFEGGISIFDIFGENKCFSSYMATTGASTSFQSTAKDFALGEFDVCSVDVSKECLNIDDTDDVPGAITYNVFGCGINDGAGAINLTTLLNSISGGAQYTPADLAWYVPGQVDDGGGLRDFDPSTDCDDGLLLQQAVDNGSEVSDLSSEDVDAGEALVYEFSETTALNGAMDTVTLDAVGTDGAPIDDDSASDTCPQIRWDASLSVNKQCAADLEDAGSTVVVKIVVEGQVCNTGEVQLTNLTLSDAASSGALGAVTVTPLSTTLEPAGETGECTPYTGYYYPSSIPGGSGSNICPFMDVVTAKAIAPPFSDTSEGTGCTVLGNGDIECSADSNSATCNLRAVDSDNDCSTGPLSPLP